MDILQVIVAVVGAGAGLFLLHLFDKYNVDKNQTKLEKTVADIKQKQANIESAQDQEDKQSQEKVDEINKEETDKPTGSNLADWFDKRK